MAETRNVTGGIIFAVADVEAIQRAARLRRQRSCFFRADMPNAGAIGDVAGFLLRSPVHRCRMALGKESLAMAESELFDRGLQARRDGLGAEYLDADLADIDEFMMAF